MYYTPPANRIKKNFSLLAGILLALITACGNPSASDSITLEIPGTGKPGSSGNRDAAVPYISSQPRDAMYTRGAPAASLTVRAMASDGGLLSYQWYSNTENRNTGGKALTGTGARSMSYRPPTDTGGIMYYYAVVTNTYFGKTATAISRAAQVTVDSRIHVATPHISSHPQGATYNFNALITLTVVVEPLSDDGNLTYQWYRNTTNVNIDGTIITGATAASYMPPTTTAGTVYYYVVVTNTIADNGDGGNKTATAYSNPAAITVNAQVNAAVPVISSHPSGAEYTYGDTGATPLTVSVEPPSDEGALTYQWYRNDENSNDGGTPISDATGTSYTPFITTAGTVYYYVVVTNTIDDNDDGGNKTAPVSSNPAGIMVAPLIVTITGVEAADKIYDGTTDATITGTAVINGLINDDDVTFTSGAATFEDKNVGEGKTVTFSGWTLGGEDVDNYTLTQPASVTANIIAKPVTIDSTNIGTPNRTLIPFGSTDTQYGKTAIFNVTVTGLITNTDPVTVGVVATNSYGLMSSSTQTGNPVTVTLTYDGTEVMQLTPVSVGLAVSGNYTLSGTAEVNVTIIDGKVSARAIPVTSADITAFNTYARTDGLTRHYKLTENVTLMPSAAGNSNWTAIGDNSTSDNDSRFTGSFNGQGNTISNLTINATTNNQGMFGCIGTGGVVQNLGLVGGSIRGYQYIGGVVGYNNGGTVQNSYVTGTVSGTYWYVGGVVGYNSSGTVQNCYTTDDIGGYWDVGGVVGYNYSGGTVQNCYATGNISGSGGAGNGEVGGVVGSNSNGTVQNCYATGNISGRNGYIRLGGIVGRGSRVENCVALNPIITSDRSDDNSDVSIERVGRGTLANNYARSDMDIRRGVDADGNGGTPKTITSSTTSTDGLNITATEWNDANWWQNTAQFPSSAWDFRNGLPILKDVGGTQNPTVQ